MSTAKKAITDFYPAPLKLSRGRILDFNSVRVMGVINITPDSFYDGGKYASTEDAIKQAEKLILDGANVIDLGACSTRPKAIDIGAKEEMKRLFPVLDNLVKNHPDLIISVDTYRAEVAKEAVERGAAIVNDISGGTMDDKMFEVVGKLGVPYILMHIQGTPETMQVEPHYINVVEEVEQFFVEGIKKLQDAGVKQIVIDPGFGFGKSVEHNYTLLQNLNKFTRLGLPVMAGLSRKSMINKVLHTKPENALTGTTVLNTLAILEGANMLRVHDVREVFQVIKLVRQFQHPKTIQ